MHLSKLSKCTLKFVYLIVFKFYIKRKRNWEKLLGKQTLADKHAAKF